MASIRRSFTGVHVEWVKDVVDFWSVISDRCIRYKLSGSYAFQIVCNDAGRVVHRTKAAMHHTQWLPIGFNAKDVQFAFPLLRDRVSAQPVKFQLVVPGITFHYPSFNSVIILYIRVYHHQES